DKTQLSYKPDVHRLRVEANPDGGSTVHVPVTMGWDTPAPKDWGDDFPGSTPDGPPMISRTVTVDVDVTLDADGRIAQYVEAHVQTPKLRVKHPDDCGGDEPRPELPWIEVRDGQIVQDLGETFVLSMRARGSNVARKVRANGQEGWTMQYVSFEVAN